MFITQHPSNRSPDTIAWKQQPFVHTLLVIRPTPGDNMSYVLILLAKQLPILPALGILMFFSQQVDIKGAQVCLPDHCPCHIRHTCCYTERIY